MKGEKMEITINLTENRPENRTEIKYGHNYLVVYFDARARKRLACARGAGAGEFEFCRRRFLHKEDEPRFDPITKKWRATIIGWQNLKDWKENE
jgi:hypothetical protein